MAGQIPDKTYPISMEVQGPMGMFARPDSGSELTSYCVPPKSAAKGMFESILYDPRVEVQPQFVRVCRMPHFVDAGISTAFSPLRPPHSQNNGYSLQRRMIALSHPHFQLYAVARQIKPDKINHGHSYQGRFNRRIKMGRSFRTVSLGTSDCPATYFGPWRDETEVCSDFNTTIPLMLVHPFDQNQNGQSFSPRWARNAKITQGVMYYDQ